MVWGDRHVRVRRSRLKVVHAPKTCGRTGLHAVGERQEHTLDWSPTHTCRQLRVSSQPTLDCRRKQEYPANNKIT
ncbi:hypothetical protein ANANG_G00263770 [Anguilla anguilla]|uniref:Uncharacterized protein n=1 Tax=Anguilla anguilla TaxID=7936 RepID=A0A9D3RL72_ANGAN|nr:hypothetical protein ANANG_G00263770 [Anguilla anguilla]